MRSRSFHAFAVAGGFALVAAAPLAPQDPSSFGEAITVRVVNVDVIATDKHGNFVPDLRREDFELLEDGKPVEITYFALYGAGVAPLPAGETAPAPAAPLDQPFLEPPPATYAVLVDQTLLQPGERNAVLDSLENFLTRHLRPEDKVLLATYAGRLRMLTTLSADRRELQHGLAELRASARPRNPVASRESLLMREMANVDNNASIRDTQIDSIQFQIQMLAEEEGQQNLNAVKMTSAFVDAVSALEGRKALVYVGGGVSSEPAARLAAAFERRFGDSRDLERAQDLALDIVTERAQMVARAGAGRVTFYVINAGPDRGPAVLGPEESGSVGFTDPLPTSTEDPERASSLAWLARGTGGRVWNAEADMTAELGDMRFDFAQYYSLGFAAHDAGVEHDLTVRSKRPGITVRGRSSYRNPKPGEASSDAVSSLLLGRAENPLGALLEWGEARQDQGKGPWLVPMTVRIPADRITFISDGTQRLARLSIDFAAKDTTGSLHTMESREFPIAFSNEQHAEAKGKSIPFTFKLALPKGKYRVLVAVRDQMGQSLSSTTADLAVERN